MGNTKELQIKKKSGKHWETLRRVNGMEKFRKAVGNTKENEVLGKFRKTVENTKEILGKFRKTVDQKSQVHRRSPRAQNQVFAELEPF